MDNSITVVYNHSDNQERFPLSLAMTDDGGLSWTEPWHFEDIPIEVSYPGFTSGKNGTIHGVYTYNRRFIKYISFSTEEAKKACEYNRRF